MQIDRRGFLECAGAGLLLTACTTVDRKGNNSMAKPNIILCMADDQGWGDMAYNGHAVLKTPNFDAMAAEGLRFDHFYAAAPVCSPTRGSVMTGRHPNRFGCFSWGHAIRPDETTIAEALKSAGYVTGHFGKWHLGSVRKNSPVSPGACGFDEWLSSPNFFDNDPILSREGVAVQMHGESSIVTVDAAIEFIRKHASSDRPFLSVVWFGSPHAPHRALPEDCALYPDQEEHLQNFYGEITAMDRAVGKLRNELRTLNIHQNTILWYCSDNGGLKNIGSTGGRANKGSTYEGGLRVPAILEWPACVPKPRTTNMPCGTSDIYATLLDVTGVKVPNQPVLDGISLMPLLQESMDCRPEGIGFWNYPIRGSRTPSADLMAELLEMQKAGIEPDTSSHTFTNVGEIDSSHPEDSFPGQAAWLDWPWKLHRKQSKQDPADIQIELYNLADDPMEETDLTESLPDRVKTLRPALERWLCSVVHSLNGKDYR